MRLRCTKFKLILLSIATNSMITTFFRRPIAVSASFSLPFNQYGIIHRQYHRLHPETTYHQTHLFATKRKHKSFQPLSTTSTPVKKSKSKQVKQVKQESVLYAESASGYKRPVISWYPGHIAKAERLLTETLKSSDVLLEVRDGRIPQSTSHPKVVEWTRGRPRVVVLTHVDMIPKASVASWKRWWDHCLVDRKQEQREGGKNEVFVWVDAKRGAGIPALHRAIANAGVGVNERRRRRGLSDRALRVAVLGYPNVGKSALINRILGRKRAKSANTPGVTRALQWLKVGASGSLMTDQSGKSTTRGGSGDYELLDSPGIITANMENQEDAFLLACCNCIGEASYDNEGVAAYLCERIKALNLMGKGDLTSPEWRQKCIERYRFDPLKPVSVPSFSSQNDSGSEEKAIPSGEDMLHEVAHNTCRGDLEGSARKILQDFRTGRMGPMALQVAPRVDERKSGGGLEDEQMKVEVMRNVAILGEIEAVDHVLDDHLETEKRARAAVENARRKGVELPPSIEDVLQSDGPDNTNNNESDVGKGIFDGW